jgi:hypothetical protein
MEWINANKKKPRDRQECLISVVDNVWQVWYNEGSDYFVLEDENYGDDYFPCAEYSWWIPLPDPKNIFNPDVVFDA